MTSQKKFLERLVARLDDAGIPYMVSGSLGSSLHGEPRATNDIDLVIDPTREQLDDFVQSLGEEYYISPEAAADAFRSRFMFNVIDLETGWKADLVIRKHRSFSIEEFKRRVTGVILGLQVQVVSPEDAILSKLEWAQAAQSERQFRDALGILLVLEDDVDKDYLRKWAAELKVEDLLESLLNQAGKSGAD